MYKGENSLTLELDQQKLTTFVLLHVQGSNLINFGTGSTKTDYYYMYKGENSLTLELNQLKLTIITCTRVKTL